MEEAVLLSKQPMGFVVIGHLPFRQGCLHSEKALLRFEKPVLHAENARLHLENAVFFSDAEKAFYNTVKVFIW